MASTINCGPSSSSDSFVTEIQNLMYAMGDLKRPRLDSAELIQNAVRASVLRIMENAQQLADMRGAQWFSAEDLVFVLRKDRQLLRRLIRQTKLKDLKSATLKQFDDCAQSSTDISLSALAESAAPCLGASNSSGSSKAASRFKWLQNTVQKFDSGELSELFHDTVSIDAVKKERLLRAEAQARSMALSEYMRFSEVRATSFYKPQTAKKFKDWLFQGPFSLHSAVTGNILDVLSFLAYETVATILDTAFLVKREASSGKHSEGTMVRLRDKHAVREPQVQSGSNTHYPQRLLASSSFNINSGDGVQTTSFSAALSPDIIHEALRRLSQDAVQNCPCVLFCCYPKTYRQAKRLRLY